ncbi:MAG: BamA/TamA family outer membrane protein [Bacteroidota bacterium]
MTSFLKDTTKLVSFLCCSLFSFSVVGQEVDLTDTTKISQRNSFFAVPVVFFSPETDCAFGDTGIYAFRFKKEKNTARPSQLTLGFAYTLDKQVLLYLPYQLFVKDQTYNIYGELGYYLYSYQFFGLGNDTKQDDREIYKVNFPRIRLNALKLLRSNLYGGFRYWMDDFDIREIEAGGLLDSEKIVGQDGGFLSGAGLVLNYDNRNNIFFPTKGIFAEVVGFSNGSYLGSDFNFTKFTIDVSKYIGFEDQVMALNFYSEFTGGNAPFNQLALLGGNRKMRGYFEGQLRDNHQMVLQSEYRFPVYKKRLRGVLFGGIGQVANQLSDFGVSNLKYTYGAGLRILINEKERIHVRLDAGFGKETSGYYITIGEAF